MSKIASISVVGLSVILIVWLMRSFGVAAGVLFVPLLFALYALVNPRPVLLVYLVFISCSGMITANLRLPLIDYVDEIILVTLSLSVALHFLLRRLPVERMSVIGCHMAALCFVTILSWYVNRSPVMQLIHFVLTYLGFVPIFLLGTIVSSKFATTDPLRWLAWFLPLQLVLNIMWMAGINPFANHQWLFFDRAIGTFYDSHMLGYFMMFMIIAITSGWVHARDRSRRLRYVLLLVLALLQYLMTFVMHTIPLLIVLLFLGAIWFWKDHLGRIMKVTFSVSVVIMVISLVLFALDANLLKTVHKDLTWTRIKPYLTRVQHSPKGMVYSNVFAKAPQNMRQRILGFGPGNFASVVGVQYGSVHTRRYIGYMYDTYEGRRLWQGTSFVENPQTGVTGVVSEIGLLGGGLYVLVHVSAIVHFWRAIKRRRYAHASDLAMAQSWLLMTLGYLLLSFVWDVFHFDLFSSGLWLWAGLLWHRDTGQAEDSDLRQASSDLERNENMETNYFEC